MERLDSTLTLYVVRHGRSKYLERHSVQDFGKWEPDIWDITDRGETELNNTFWLIKYSLGEELEPEQNTLVFFTSPRARALSTRQYLQEWFNSFGFETCEGLSAILEVLRSGGDDSPIVGEDNKVVNFDGSEYDRSLIHDEGSGRTRGRRFREFLSFFASVDREKFAKMTAYAEALRGRRPIFIAITHGEVLHAQGVRTNGYGFPYDLGCDYEWTHELLKQCIQGDYEVSFLGRAFPELDLVKVRRGGFMRLDFDLKNPGYFSLLVHPEPEPFCKELKTNLRLNQANGLIEQT